MDIILAVNLGRSFVRIPSSRVPSFHDLVLNVAEHSNPNDEDDVHDKFVFEINKGEECSLTSEPEFANMLLLCKLLKVYSVNVTVVPSQPSLNHEGGSNLRDGSIPNFFKASKETFFDLNEPPLSNEGDSGMHTSSKAGSLSQKRKDRQNGRIRGEFYRGATTRIPTFDISPDQPDVVLKSANWVNFIEGVGQEFRGGVKEFRIKLIKYAARCGFHFVYLKNDNDYVIAVCHLREADGCNWTVRANRCRISNAMVITEVVLAHSCKLSMMRNDSKRLGAKVLGDLITNAVRNNPSYTAISLKKHLLLDYGFEIPYEKVWRGLQVAKGSIFGSFEESFNELKWYEKAIHITNPGSVTSLEMDTKTNSFSRFFVSFNASIVGFQHCRPILFVDGTFMKTRYKGTLLSATAKDGNNGLFPVAVAIVACENTENWKWFINLIKDHITHPKEIMYVSDRAGGLINAFNEVYEKPLHYFCLYHLMKNLRGMYSGRKYSEVFKNFMCKLLKDVAYAPNRRLFDQAMSLFLYKGGEIAKQFLVDLPRDKWAVAFSPDVHRYGELTSNAAESFNNWIMDARSLPVTFMIDCIRAKIMKWFDERRTDSKKWSGALTKNMEIIWNADESISSSWIINPTNTNGEFEVLCNDSCVVNLRTCRCSCYQWQVRGFPCCHAIAVITRSRWNLKEVVDSVFFSSTYRKVYVLDLYAIPSTLRYELIDHTDMSKIQPPVIRRPIGRPRVKRFKSSGEPIPRRKKFRCGRCGKVGTHEWATCGEALN